MNWKQLIKPMSDYLGLNINTDLTMIAQYYENECTREGLNRAILNEFSKVPTKMTIWRFWRVCLSIHIGRQIMIQS